MTRNHAEAGTVIRLRELTCPGEPLRDGFPRASGERSHAAVDLDPGDHALPLERLHERSPVGALRPDGLVEADHPADVSGHAVRPKEELPVVPTIRPGAFDADGREALRHRPGALVRSQDSLFRRHHGPGRGAAGCRESGWMRTAPGGARGGRAHGSGWVERQARERTAAPASTSPRSGTPVAAPAQRSAVVNHHAAADLVRHDERPDTRRPGDVPCCHGPLITSPEIDHADAPSPTDGSRQPPRACRACGVRGGGSRAGTRARAEHDRVA
jgi:hypothetical protein